MSGEKKDGRPTYEQIGQQKKAEYSGVLVQHVNEMSKLEAEIQITESNLVNMKQRLKGLSEDKERILAAIGVLTEIDKTIKEMVPKD
jgi:hypothetical protein